MSTSRTREKADGELFKSTGIDDNATSTAITIDASENVGIGGSPANPFHVTKEIAGYQAYFNNDNGSAQGLKVRVKANDSGNFNILDLVSAATGSDVSVMTVRDDGNVGIGVVPEAWHSVWSATRIGDGASLTGRSDVSSADLGSNFYINATADFKAIDTSGASRHYMYNGAHYFYVDPPSSAGRTISWTTAMTIDNAGKLTIPARAFEVGTFSSSGASAGVKHNIWGNNEIGIGSSVASSSGQSHYAFYNTNGNVGYIQTSGSSTIYSTSSDYRLKENVTPMSGATAQTKLLKPCNFDWIAGGNVNGFIAHELAEVVPEAVTGTKDAMRDEEYEVTPAVIDDEGNETTAAVMGTRSVPDMQGIDQSKLVPLLTATIQELIARIEALEA